MRTGEEWEAFGTREGEARCVFAGWQVPDHKRCVVATSLVEKYHFLTLFNGSHKYHVIRVVIAISKWDIYFVSFL